MKKLWKKAKTRLRDDSERGARESLLEELFNDFNRNRFSVYKFNFMRGIFFGFGSVIGGTIVVALIIWVLSVVGFWVPALAGLVQHVIDVIDKTSH